MTLTQRLARVFYRWAITLDPAIRAQPVPASIARPSAPHRFTIRVDGQVRHTTSEPAVARDVFFAFQDPTQWTDVELWDGPHRRDRWARGW